MPALLASGRRWAGRACCMHFLPAAIRDERLGTVAADERTAIRAAHADRQLTEVADDLAKRKPAVILVDDAAKKLGFGDKPFDYLDYLGRDPRYRSVFAGYEEGRKIGPFRVFLRR